MTHVDADPTRRSASPSVLPLLVFVLALAIRLAYQADYDARIGVDTTRIPDLDQSAFHLTATRIANGDWPLRHVYRPYHWWYQRIASEATFDSWYPKNAFHQSPLYPYLVGTVYANFGPDPAIVFRIQALFGALTAAVVFLMARRFMSPWAASAAGLGMAFFGPAIAYDSTLLRASLVTFTTSLWLLTWLRALEGRSSVSRWAVCAAVFALCVLAKPNIAIFAPVLAVSLVIAHRRDRRAVALRLAASIAAFLLVLAPAIARNVAVGAPPFVLTTRGPYAFVNGNALGSDGTGWFPPETQVELLDGSANEILNRTQGATLPTIRATLATHADAPLGYLSLLSKKAFAFFRADEIPNNFDVGVHVRAIPWTAWLVRFGFIAPFAMIGLFFACRSRRMLPLVVFVVGYVLVTIAFYVIGRFRLPVVPVLMIFGAYGVDALVRLVRERRLASVAATVVALALVAVALRPANPLPSRTQAWVAVGDHLSLSGRGGEAGAWYRRALVSSGPAEDRLSAASRLVQLRFIDPNTAGAVSSIEVMRALRELLGEDLSADRRADAHCIVASVYYYGDQRGPARVEVEEALRVDPGNADASLFQAMLLHAEGESDAALRAVETLLAQKPEHAQSLLFRGELLQLKGELRESKESIRAAIRFAGTDRMTRDRALELLYGPGGGIR